MAINIVAMVQERVPATLSDGTQGVVTETTLYIPPQYAGGNEITIRTTDNCEELKKDVKVFNSHIEASLYAFNLVYG